MAIKKNGRILFEQMKTKRILVGISGASGAPIAIQLLKRLKEMETVETHLLLTRGAELTISQETAYSAEQVMYVMT